MDRLIKAFWSICRLRLGPQDLPSSYALVVLSLAAYASVSFLSGLPHLAWGEAFAAGLVDVGLLALLCYLILWIRLLTARWYQTVTALAGSRALIDAIGLPFAYMQAAAGETVAAILPTLALIALLVWTLFVVAHILRNALNIPLMLASALGGLYLYINLRVLATLFAVTPK